MRRVKTLILCLEDREANLSLLKAVLEEAGYNVIGVSTERDALKVLGECPVCLTLSDHILRGTTGIQVAAKMKKIKADVPIVLHSGSNPDTMKNLDGFMNKEVPTTHFLAMIQDFISRYYS